MAMAGRMLSVQSGRPSLRIYFMKIRITLVVTIVAALSVNAAAAQPDVGTVRVYDSAEIAFDRYVVLKRLWVEGWRSAFRIQGHRTPEAARQALMSEAARLGADGVVNLSCFDRDDSIFWGRGHYCYGSAIRLK